MSTIKLDKTAFPLYAIVPLNSELFVAAGGGGAAKTGIKNAIIVYKLEKVENTFKAVSICTLDTGLRSVMNMALSPSREVIAAGMDHLCQFFSCRFEDVKKGSKEKKFALKELKNVATVAEPSNEEDDDEEAAYQKCVAFTPDGRHVVTGGTDGKIKVLKYPSLDEAHDIQGHKSEIDDIDVHPNSKLFLSVGKESSANLWKLESGEKELELPFSVDKKDEDMYRFRNCRFSKNLDSNEICLYTTHIPKKFSKLKPPSCLVKWDTRKWCPDLMVQVPKMSISALATSSSGRYVAIGTADGSIQVFVSWNMSRVRTIKDVHEIFITSLNFLPENRMMCEDMKLDAAILSCSIDNSCQLTLVPSRREYPFTMVIILFIATLLLIFNIISYYDLDF